jgi:GTPase SAR1 family protein
VTNWLRQIESHASQDVALILVANKVDLPNRQVTKEQGEQLAAKNKLGYFETSALQGVNINEVFYELAQTIIKSQPQQTQVTSVSTRTTAISTDSSAEQYRAGAAGIQLNSAQSFAEPPAQDSSLCC